MSVLKGRRVPVVPVETERGLRSVYRIECGSCGATHDLPQPPTGGVRSIQEISKILGRRGWFVHNRLAKKDRCPACVTKRETTQPKASPVEEFVHDPPPDVAELLEDWVEEVETMTTNGMPVQVIGGEAAQLVLPSAPVEPDIDAVLLISARLDEVHLGAGKGYADQWTDHTLAADLGVPRAWVRSIREKKFGVCTNTNDEISKALGEAKALAERVTAVTEQASAVMKAVTHLTNEVGVMLKRLNSIEQSLS